MQPFARIFTLAALSAFLATGALAAPSPAPSPELTRRQAEIPNVVPFAPTPVKTLKKRHMTNGQRLARGLPLNPPMRRDGRLVARTSPTPVVDAAGAAPTPVNGASCSPRSGLIEITSTDGSITGYLADITTRFGQYGFSPNKTDAIEVQVHCDGNRFDITTLNTTAPYGYIGGVTGLSSISNDLLPGSSNYAYFAGVTPTTPGAAPCSQDSSFSHVTSIANTVESAIWSMDESTALLTPHWVNTDSSEVPTYIAFYKALNLLYFTGDIQEFAGVIGEAIHEVNFTLVSA
ncbi:hypothetical protein PHLGIDRAFT_33538 [Phlebiopsis gigantea 11061_1 CR5-6]|uniref:Carboxylic ester hydrolase n=1 Tax=Phlebiopsis gigantea (strain 11061_1 CR5-6) TaxID=745531 RepID=A0A0C3SEZ5_PHLG1|nr:hypothetical protein PHLGIDRAFT_33538 [Phlebiopsis gigantea 11061_1 CR5-6]